MSPDLLDKVDDLLLGGVGGDELVQVGHDVHTDAAGQLVLGLGDGGHGQDHGGEDNENLDMEKSEDKRCYTEIPSLWRPYEE